MFSKSQEYVDHAIDDLVRRLIEPEPASADQRANVADELNEEDELDAYYAMLKSTQSRISTILTSRNDRSLIHRVPEEVLISIVSLSLPSLYGSDKSFYYPYLKGLRRVCRLWANLIDSCPMFWCFVTGDMKCGRLEKIIERSRDAPLIFDQMNYAQPVEGYLKILKPHLVRCRSLALTMAMQEGAFAAAALEASSTAIERLDFNSGWSSEATLYAAFQSLSTSSFPRLTEVILQSVSGLQPYPWLANLRFLSLQQVNPNVYTLFEILKSCASLVEFHLGRYSPGDLQVEEGPGIGDTGERIYLLHLTHLTLFTSTEQVRLLLTWIHAPKCRDLSLGLDSMYLDDDRNIPRRVAAAAPHLSSFLSRCHIVPSERTLKLRPDGFKLHGTGFSVDFGAYSSARRLSKLTNYLPALEGMPAPLLESVVTLEVELRVKGCNNVLCTMAKLVPDVSTLVLPVSWGDRHDGLAELTRAIKADVNTEGPKIWLLPNLSALRIYIRHTVGLGRMGDRPESHTRVLRKLLNVAKARNKTKADASGQVSVEARVDRVAALQRLELQSEVSAGGKNKVLLREIKRWMPEVILQPPEPGLQYPPRYPPFNGWSILY